MFSAALFDDAFRDYSRHAVEMSRKSCCEFRQQFLARNQTTQEIIFVEAFGKWVVNKHGEPVCLHGFNRKLTPTCFHRAFDRLNFRRIVSEWEREGRIPEEFINARYGSERT